MNKTTNFFLVAILAIAFVGLVVGLQKGADVKVGSSDYNKLDDGVTHTSVSVSIVATGTTQVLAANPSASYRRIQNTGNYNASCQLDDATSTLVVGTGIILYSSSSVNSIYEINPFNLYRGKIRCIATTATTTISTVER
jgi:hypothetical protein